MDLPFGRPFNREANTLDLVDFEPHAVGQHAVGSGAVIAAVLHGYAYLNDTVKVDDQLDSILASLAKSSSICPISFLTTHSVSSSNGTIPKYMKGEDKGCEP